MLLRFMMLVSALFFCLEAYSRPCDKLAGTWQGQWSEANHSYATKLQLNWPNPQTLMGTFYFSQGNSGTFIGSCQAFAFQQAYLQIRPSPPWYNLCQGFLITHPDLILHIFCFNPNQSGYFYLLKQA